MQSGTCTFFGAFTIALGSPLQRPGAAGSLANPGSYLDQNRVTSAMARCWLGLSYTRSNVSLECCAIDAVRSGSALRRRSQFTRVARSTLAHTNRDPSRLQISRSLDSESLSSSLEDSVNGNR